MREEDMSNISGGWADAEEISESQDVEIEELKNVLIRADLTDKLKMLAVADKLRNDVRRLRLEVDVWKKKPSMNIQKKYDDLLDAVKKERFIAGKLDYLWDNRAKIDKLVFWDTCGGYDAELDAARAEVDKLISEGCEA